MRNTNTSRAVATAMLRSSGKTLWHASQGTFAESPRAARRALIRTLGIRQFKKQRRLALHGAPNA